jgi:alpha-tubulin suppressor-like RCC1 family protein
VALSGTTRVDTTTQGGITPPTLYSAVATGARHACGFPRAAVGVVQTPWCWGQNISGQVGNGSTVDTLRPSQVPLPIGVTAFDSTSVVAGAAHTCALVLTGTVPAGTAFCWGNNALGQLGLGAASGVPVTAPTQVDASTPVFAKLYAGLNHTCGLTSAGAAYCWGYNASGQLGDGTQTNQAIAVPVLGGPFANLAMGEQHTCGITVAAPVAVFCWGDNSFGQLGTNDFVAVLTPTKVSFQK